MKRLDMNKRIILKSVTIAFLAVLMGACTNASRPSNQSETQEETASKRLNRNVKIGFQGILLGTPNIDIPALFNRLTNVTKSDIPDDIRQIQSGSAASFYANKYEKIIGTFKSVVIDTADFSHEGYGMMLSDGDSITQIVFTIKEAEDPSGVYNRLLPLFINQYGNPDEYYETEVESYLKNVGAIWKFDNKQRICLNLCIYPGGAKLVEFESFFEALQRVEIIYQNTNALEHKEAWEKQEEQDRIDAEEKEIEKNREKRKIQQL